MKKVLIAGGNASSVTLKYPLGPSWSPAGWAGMLCQGCGWWSSCRPSHPDPSLPDRGTTTSAPVCSHTPGCDPRARGWHPVRPAWQQQTPWGFYTALPPALPLFDNWHSSDSLKITFFPCLQTKRGIWNNTLALSSSSNSTGSGSYTKMLQKVISHFNSSILCPLHFAGSPWSPPLMKEEAFFLVVHNTPIHVRPWLLYACSLVGEKGNILSPDHTRDSKIKRSTINLDQAHRHKILQQPLQHPGSPICFQKGCSYAWTEHVNNCIMN